MQVTDGDVHDLDFPDRSFDTVTASLVFCSVTDPVRALREIHRVLRPGGRLLFHEHVRGHGVRAVLQDLLTPLQRRMADGCHANRDFERFLFEMNDRDGGMTGEQLQRFRAIGRLDVEGDQFERWVEPVFRAARFDDAQTVEIMSEVHARTGEFVDPHPGETLPEGAFVQAGPYADGRIGNRLVRPDDLYIVADGKLRKAEVEQLEAAAPASSADVPPPASTASPTTRRRATTSLAMAPQASPGSLGRAARPRLHSRVLAARRARYFAACEHRRQPVLA